MVNLLELAVKVLRVVESARPRTSTSRTLSNVLTLSEQKLSGTQNSHKVAHGSGSRLTLPVGMGMLH